jgi:hypothetical protein
LLYLSAAKKWVKYTCTNAIKQMAFEFFHKKRCLLFLLKKYYSLRRDVR